MSIQQTSMALQFSSVIRVDEAINAEDAST